MKNLTYRKDHIEAVSLQFDPDRVTYQRLLELFWDYHDWTLENPHQVWCQSFQPFILSQASVVKSGNSPAVQYSSFIFCHDEEQKSAAEASFLEMLKKTEKKVRTKIGTYTQFWQADEYANSVLKLKITLDTTRSWLFNYLQLLILTTYCCSDFQHNLLQQHKNIFPRLHIPFVQLAHSHLA